MEKWDIVKHQNTLVMLLDRIEKSCGIFWKVSAPNLSYQNQKIYLVSEAELQPTIAEYQIPVTWENCGMVSVTAASMKEAIQNFDRDIDEFPLPDNENYIDSSFQRDQYDTLEETAAVYASNMLPCINFHQI